MIYFLTTLLTCAYSQYFLGGGIAVYEPSHNKKDWVTSRRLGNTKWGLWGDWHYCPEGEFAIKLAVKVEGWSSDDNTGLNGIRIVCSDQPYGIGGIATADQSANGNYGHWRIPYAECEEGSFMTGMIVWSQPIQGGDDDDAGATNVWPICNKPLGTQNTEKIVKTKVSEWKDGDFKGDSKMKGEMRRDHDTCPKGYGIAGFRTKVEPVQGAEDDDSSLNRVQFVCRKFPKCSHIEVTDIRLMETSRRLTKMPEKGKETLHMLVAEADNCESQEPLTWHGTTQQGYERSVTEEYTSTETWEQTMGQSTTRDVTVSVRHSIEPEVALGYEAGAEFGFSYSHSKSKSWETTTSSSSSSAKGETTIKSKTDTNGNGVEVPPFNKFRIETVVETYRASVDYVGVAQCYRTKAKKDSEKMGKPVTYHGTFKGVAVGRENVKLIDLSSECKNRQGIKSDYETCQCAGVFEDHGGNGGNLRAMLRDLLAEQNAARNGADAIRGVGGEECTDRAVDPALKTKAPLKNRGTWCYVYKGSCKADEEFPITVDYDAGVDPDVFAWSKAPCKGKEARKRRMIEELEAPL